MAVCSIPPAAAAEGAWGSAEHRAYYGKGLKSWEWHRRRRVGTADLLQGKTWILGQLSPPGRADVAASQLMDGSWQDVGPVGSHPAVALRISVSWHKAHPALQAVPFYATGIHTGLWPLSTAGDGWGRAGRSLGARLGQ